MTVDGDTYSTHSRRTYAAEIKASRRAGRAAPGSPAVITQSRSLYQPRPRTGTIGARHSDLTQGDATDVITIHTLPRESAIKYAIQDTYPDRGWTVGHSQRRIGLIASAACVARRAVRIPGAGWNIRRLEI